MYQHPLGRESTDSQDYQPPDDRSSTESLIKPPPYVESADGHTVKDVSVDIERQAVMRTPSPTPEEAEFLAKKDGPDWEKMKDWHFWVSKPVLSSYLRML